MKNFILFTLTLFNLNVFSQSTPDTLWTKTIGGSGDDPPFYYPRLNALVDMTAQGDLFVVSSVNSGDGWVNNNIGGLDCWLIKMNTNGDTIWTKVFGGTNFDAVHSIVALDNGGCAVAGYTYSNDNDFPNNHDSDGLYPDGFVIVFDADGNKVWSRLYGGSYNALQLGGQDYFKKIILNNSGNLVVYGETNSINGDLYLDYNLFYVTWFLELNPENGDIITNRRIAGYNHNEWNLNYSADIYKLNDNSGYITLGSQTYGLAGGDYFWVTKLDNNADTVWTAEYGCENYNRPGEIVQTDDGGFLLAGTINEASGDVTNLIGGYDLWLAKTDANGNITNQISYGGTSHEMIYSLAADNKGNWFGAVQTRSDDIFAPNGYGETDFLLINFDSNLDTLYTYRMGGTGFESLTDVVTTPSGDSIFAVGVTDSNNFYIHNNNGLKDLWITSIYRETSSIKELSYIDKKLGFYCFPNPSDGNFSINIDKNFENIKTKSVIITDIAGKVVFDKKDLTQFPLKINLTDLSKGIYFINIQANKGVFSNKIILE